MEENKKPSKIIELLILSNLVSMIAHVDTTDKTKKRTNSKLNFLLPKIKIANGNKPAIS